MAKLVTIDKYSLLEKVFKFHLTNPKDIIIITGAPGIGKSEITISTIMGLNASRAKMLQDIYAIKSGNLPEGIDPNQLKKKYVPIVERSYQRGDFAPGMGYIDIEKKLTASTKPIWLQKINDVQAAGDIPVLIMEDAHLTLPYNQNMLYEYYEQFQINEYKAEPHPIIIIGNWGVRSAKCHDFQSPVMGRVTAYYKFVPNMEEWIVRFQNIIDPKLKVFLAKYPEAFYTEDPREMEKFSSPRDFMRFNEQITKNPMGIKSAPAYIGEIGFKFIQDYDHLYDNVDRIMKEKYTDLPSRIRAAEQLGYLVEADRVNEIYNFIDDEYKSEEALIMYQKIIIMRRLLSKLKDNEKAQKMAKKLNEIIAS